MRRRDFIAGLATAAAIGTAQAQQASRVWRVAQVLPGSESRTGFIASALKQRLVELGDDRIVVMTERYVAPDLTSIEAEIRAQSQDKDLLVVWSTIGGIAAKRVAPSLPVVFMSVGAPVDIGLVESLAHPGGTMTGVTFEAATQTYAKRLELLREIVPTLSLVAVLGAHGDPNVSFAMRSLERSAPQLEVRLLPIDVSGPGDLDDAFELMSASRAQGLIIIAGALTFNADTRIAELALAHRLPSCGGFKETVRAGGLISLGPDYIAIARQGADIVDKILHGSKAADLPVEQPERYEIYLNLKTARTLGLNIPASLIARADEVIE